MKKSNAKEVCKNLNLLREMAVGQTYDYAAILKTLKGVVPCIPNNLPVAIKYGLIIRKSRGLYEFPEEPVYIGKVEQYLKEYKTYSPLKKETTGEPVEVMDDSDCIEKAISILKETGDYKVYKKIVEIRWEEV